MPLRLAVCFFTSHLAIFQLQLYIVTGHASSEIGSMGIVEDLLQNECLLIFALDDNLFCYTGINMKKNKRQSNAIYSNSDFTVSDLNIYTYIPMDSWDVNKLRIKSPT